MILATLEAWGKAIAAACGFGEKVTAEIHDGHQRDAGRNEVKAADGAASAEVNANVAKAAVEVNDSAALERLFNGKS